MPDEIPVGLFDGIPGFKEAAANRKWLPDGVVDFEQYKFTKQLMKIIREAREEMLNGPL